MWPSTTSFTSQRRRGRRSRLAAARRRRRRRRSLHPRARSETPRPAHRARSRCPTSTLALNPASAAPALGTPRLARGAAQTRPAAKHARDSRVQSTRARAPQRSSVPHVIPRPSPARRVQARPRQDARRGPLREAGAADPRAQSAAASWRQPERLAEPAGPEKAVAVESHAAARAAMQDAGGRADGRARRQCDQGRADWRSLSDEVRCTISNLPHATA